MSSNPCCKNCEHGYLSEQRNQLECHKEPPQAVTVGYLAETQDKDVPNLDIEGGTKKVLLQKTNVSFGWAFPAVQPNDRCSHWLKAPIPF